VTGLSRFSHEHPLILLTDYPADTQGGGAVILRSLLGPADRERLIWMSPVPPSNIVAAGPNVVTLKSGSSGRGKRSIVADTLLYSRRLAAEILAEAKTRGAQAIWVVMHNAAVSIAAELNRRGDLPMHLTVHDDPAFANALRSKRYFALIPWIERDFAYAMKHAKSVDVIGQAMGERYQKRYGVSSTIVHRAMDEPVVPGPLYDRERNGIRVGVLGSTYSYEQLPLLARSVEIAADRLKVRGSVRVMGRSYGERLRDEWGQRVNIEVTGHVSESEAIPHLRDCFALYLNYPFGRRDAVLRQTSFPTKLSTYIQAARPLLLHVPPDSSVMPLVNDKGFAFAWCNLDPNSGAEALLKAWETPANHQSQHVEAESVRQSYYHGDRNRAALFEALDALARSGNVSS
jgi:hypothetical protein